MKAKLILEDGTVFEGSSFGARGEAFGEVVFNTAMSGYQEILTDPSYKGQIVTMTYPLIGNYGTNKEDIESRRPWAEGFVVKERSAISSNWRSDSTLDAYLKKHNIIGIENIDTRALTRHIRLQGAMKAVISTRAGCIKALVDRVKSSAGLVGRDLVKDVTCRRAYEYRLQRTECSGQRGPRAKPRGEQKKIKTYKVVVVDCGVKLNILRELAQRDLRVLVVPAKTKAEDILAMKPDGIFLSNGPGDPEGVPYVVETVRKLLKTGPVIPIMGICLGQQMLGLALDGKTYKLKFGHHGANHPVRDLKTGKIAITSQNHGFCVDINSLPKKDIEITHINLNDNTLEGIRHKHLPVFSVQYHPEASPGPNDAKSLFDEFTRMMDKHAKKKGY